MNEGKQKTAQKQQEAVRPGRTAVAESPAAAPFLPTISPGQWADVPVTPTSRSVRQASLLQIQRQTNNTQVQRLLRASRSAPANGRLQPQPEPNAPGPEGLEGGSGQPALLPVTPPPPNGNGHTSYIQREESNTDTPTEAEKAAALAKAQAAEAAANQAAAEAAQQTAKSQAEKAAEKEAGQSAKQKAAMEGAAAKEKSAAKKGDTKKEKPPAVKKGAAGGAEAAAAPLNGVGPEAKAPKSPAEDPAFQNVVGGIKGAGKRQKAHAPAAAKAAEAQDAAEAPASETEARAQANQAGKIEQSETPGFDAAAFKAQLMQRIEQLSPKSAKEADEFKESNKLDGVKGAMQGKASQETKAAKTPMETEMGAAPDTGSVPPKPVTPLPETEPGAPPAVGTANATPKPKGQGEVETPLQENSAKLDDEMANNDITEEQLEKANEPEFSTAVAAKKESQADAKKAPQEARHFEQTQLGQAKEDADSAAQEKLAAMHDGRSQILNQIAGHQTQTKSEDEKARQKVAAEIQKIYEETKIRTEKILQDLDGKVSQTFDAGAAAAKQAFEDYVESKMNAYKERRYGGWLGWAKWVKDKVAGMPGEVNAFYAQGRRLFLAKMDAVIDKVVAIIERGLSEAKAEIANGKKRIQTYVDGLPDDLRQVGQQAAQEMDGKFQQLEQSVDDKQNELIDTLANKYNEHLQAVDARIEELKAANQGLVDKAIGAIKGVIETIKKLKEMLLGVLASAADVIGKIIKDPIGFVGNLISGVKQGFMNFVGNIATHLKKGLMSWLFGAMAEAGIQLPESFDLKGIFTLVMQVLGMTWANIRARAVKMFGEKIVAGLEKAFDIFMIIKDQGLAGLWEFIKDKLTDLKEMVLEGIKDMVITQVIKAGVQWLIGLLGGPAGAFIKAVMAIIDIVMWFVNNAGRLMSLIQAILQSVKEIAVGNIGAAAKYIEDSLAKAIPVVIGFLASLLGLGGLAQKVKGIIKRVQAPINKAIDWILGKAKAVVKKLGKALGLGKKDGAATGADKKVNEQARKKARQQVATVTQRPFKDEREMRTAVKRIEANLIPEGLHSLKITPRQGKLGEYDIVARAEAEDVGDASLEQTSEVPFKEGDKVKVKFRGEKKRFSSSTVTKVDTDQGMVWFTRTVDNAKRGIPFARIKELENIEWTVGEGTHSAFKPVIYEAKIVGEEWVVTFGYEDDDRNMKFTVRQRLSDYMTTSVKGTNLSVKPVTGRGVTETIASHEVNKGLNNAHLIADWFGGSGYKESLNLVTTSDHFNKQVMGGVEREIARRFGDANAASMDLRVNVTWGEFLDGQAAPESEAQIQARVAAEIEAADQATASERIKQFIQANRNRAQLRARRCQEVTYQATFKNEQGAVVGNHLQAIGPDNWVEE